MLLQDVVGSAEVRLSSYEWDVSLLLKIVCGHRPENECKFPSGVPNASIPRGIGMQCCGRSLTADDNEKNRKAYMKLALACDDVVSFQLVKRSTITDYPYGDATATWTALQSRWAPMNERGKQATAVVHFCVMKLEDASMDPEIWIIKRKRILAKLDEICEQVSDIKRSDRYTCGRRFGLAQFINATPVVRFAHDRLCSI
jgi:hypothetical protein